MKMGILSLPISSPHREARFQKAYKELLFVLLVSFPFCLFFIFYIHPLLFYLTPPNTHTEER
jgi:uncharacterized membrane protein